MKRSLMLGAIVVLTLTLGLLYSIPARAQDNGSQPSAVGFGAGAGDHGIPRGSTVRHFQDGTTRVYGPDGSLMITANDSESGLIDTPTGSSRTTHVFNVPSGSEIEVKGNETDIFENGDVLLRVIDEATAPATPFNGWIEQANNWAAGSLDYFAAIWVVPTSPANTKTGAVDFLFNAIEPAATGNAIIQPVLEYNQAGLPGWYLQSWYGINNNYYASSPVQVAVGDKLSGVLSHSRSGWSVVAQDTSAKNKSTSLSTRSLGTSNLAVFCALEGYGVASNADVPGDTSFSNMTFRYNGKSRSISWNPYISQGTGLTGLDVEVTSSSAVMLETTDTVLAPVQH